MSKLSLSITKSLIKGKDDTESIVYLYNYTKDTPKRNQIGQEANGLILDFEGNVISQSFPRFFDIGEDGFTMIDWGCACAERLESGIFINVYNFDTQWHMQTKKSVNASDKIDVRSKTLLTCKQWASSILTGKFHGEKWEKVFQEQGDPEMCFTFELVVPGAKKATNYDGPDMILLSMFDKAENEEINYAIVNDFADSLGLTRPPSVMVRNLTDVERLLADLTDEEAGLVIIDTNYNRVRVKNMKHIVAANSLDYGVNIKPRHFIELIMEGGSDLAARESKAYGNFIKFLEDEIDGLTEELNFMYIQCRNMTSRKKFAEAIKNVPFNQILFALQSGKIMSVEEGMYSTNYDKLAEEIKNRKKEEFEKLFDAILKFEHKKTKKSMGEE